MIFISNSAVQQTEKKKTKPQVSPVDGDKEHVGIGKRSLYLHTSVNPYKYTAKPQINEKDVEGAIGEVSKFTQDGKLYKAYYSTKYGDFTGYKTKAGTAGDVFQMKFKYGDAEYTANSLQTLRGRDDGVDVTGDFSGITRLSQDNLISLIGYSSYIFYDLYIGKPIEIAIKNESVRKVKPPTKGKLDFNWLIYNANTGKLDFKWLIHEFCYFKKRDLHAIDKLVYNPNESGNYIWAMVLIFHGSFVDPAWLAEAGTRGRNDEAWEQRAIEHGRKKGLWFLQNKEKFSKDILDARLNWKAIFEGP